MSIFQSGTIFSHAVSGGSLSYDSAEWAFSAPEFAPGTTPGIDAFIDHDDDEFFQGSASEEAANPVAAVEGTIPLLGFDQQDIGVFFSGLGVTSIYSSATSWTGEEDWSQQEIDIVLGALDEIEGMVNVQFTVVTNQADADLDFIKNNDSGSLGTAGVLGFNNGQTSWVEGTVRMNHTVSNRWALGREAGGRGYETLVHEIGHAMGLGHTHDEAFGSDFLRGMDTASIFSLGPDGINDPINSIMAYNDGWYAEGTSQLSYGNRQNLGAWDIAAMINRYGANTTTNTGDDTYLLSDVLATGSYFSTIWDNGGVDTIAVGTSPENAYIDLRAATLDYTIETTGGPVSHHFDNFGVFADGFTIAGGVVIENAIGGAGDDILVGNVAANLMSGNAGTDDLSGGEGDDTLDGGVDADTMSGGTGADTFQALAAELQGDMILDFEAGDTIFITDLALVDADLSVSQSGGDTQVMLDTNGDTIADIQFDLSGMFDAIELVVSNDGFATSIIFVEAGNDAPVAEDDDVSTDEATVLSGDVLADNGNGADSDPNGDPLTVSAVNGIGANVGTQITLASGALLTVNANGSFDYDPNGVFDSLDAGQSDTDSFSYTIDDGLGGTDSATVSITIDGVDNGLIPLIGTPGADTLIGTSADEFIDGLAGKDSLNGREGDDSVLGGDGNDTVRGQDGDDTVDGGLGGDTVRGDNGNDLLTGGDGNDNMGGGADNDTMDGGAGIDLIKGEAGDDVLTDFGDGSRLFGGSGNDTITSGDFDDTIKGGDGEDSIMSGGGIDDVLGQDGNDWIDLGDGDDEAQGGNDNDYIFGGLGLDRIEGNAGDDTIEGGDDFDRLIGKSGDDILRGQNGDDRLSAGIGLDTLEGGAGEDFLRAGGDADEVNGGTGDDTMEGNGGNDTFIIAMGDGADVISDFDQDGDDVLEFQGFGTDFDEASEILAVASQSGGDVLIDFGTGQTLTLDGLNLADLGADDITFG